MEILVYFTIFKKKKIKKVKLDIDRSQIKENYSS